jgi:hypothetical protein
MLVSDLRIYPIKSLGGISVPEALVNEKASGTTAGSCLLRQRVILSPSGLTTTWR